MSGKGLDIPIEPIMFVNNIHCKVHKRWAFIIGPILLLLLAQYVTYVFFKAPLCRNKLYI